MTDVVVGKWWNLLERKVLVGDKIARLIHLPSSAW